MRTNNSIKLFKRDRLPILLSGLLVLAGCAGNPLRSYDSEMRTTVALVQGGQLEQALQLLESCVSDRREIPVTGRSA